MNIDKVKELVNTEKVFRETIRKENAVRLRWMLNWQWYIDRLRERDREIQYYKTSSPKALGLCITEHEDTRSVRPFPLTTAGHYGWLASKKEFKLEVFGSYYEKYKQNTNPPDASSSIFYSTSEFGCAQGHK